MSVCLSVSQSVNIYFVSKISQELLYLETSNFVHMTSMTSCIVGKKIRTMGPGPLELFSFVLLAILTAMARGISQHMLTSWSSFFYSLTLPVVVFVSLIPFLWFTVFSTKGHNLSHHYKLY